MFEQVDGMQLKLDTLTAEVSNLKKRRVEETKIEHNDAVVKGKMMEYERLNELERDRLEKLRREIEDKLAQNCIL